MQIPRVRHLAAFACFAWLLGVAAPSQAGFDATFDGREVSCWFSDPYTYQERDGAPTTPYAAWSDSQSCGGSYSYEQTSEAITASRMAAAGVASGFYESGAANSTFMIRFTLSEATSVLLSGAIQGGDFGGSALFTLSEDLGGGNWSALYTKSAFYDSTVTPLSYGAVLPAGLYEILAEVDWDSPNESSFEEATFDFVFEVVPEPATGSLLALGLAGLGARRAGGRSRSD